MRHLRDHGVSRRVCRKKVVVKFENRKKPRLAWCREKRWWTAQYQWRKVIFRDKFVLGRTSVYICMEETWRRVETGLGEGEYGLQIQCHGVGMHLLQRRRNTYEGADKYISFLEDNI